jgi:glutathione S-transferase
MEYKTAKEARDLPGLRLALTAGLPAPWSMAARFMFDIKKIAYVPVLQQGGAPNEDLVEWTGHRNAPVAVFDDEPARTNWADILELAERLQPVPRLVPLDTEQRLRMFGLANEICGAGGLTYQARHIMIGNMLNSGIEAAQPAAQTMAKAYGYSEQAAANASSRMTQILDALAGQLESQKIKNSRYFIGDGLTALDLIWASFSNTLQPLPEEVNPMNQRMRASYQSMGDSVTTSQILFDQRDYIYENHLTLPLEF